MQRKRTKPFEQWCKNRLEVLELRKADNQSSFIIEVAATVMNWHSSLFVMFVLIYYIYKQSRAYLYFYMEVQIHLTWSGISSQIPRYESTIPFWWQLLYEWFSALWVFQGISPDRSIVQGVCSKRDIVDLIYVHFGRRNILIDAMWRGYYEYD